MSTDGHEPQKDDKTCNGGCNPAPDAGEAVVDFTDSGVDSLDAFINIALQARANALEAQDKSLSKTMRREAVVAARKHVALAANMSVEVRKSLSAIEI